MAEEPKNLHEYTAQKRAVKQREHIEQTSSLERMVLGLKEFFGRGESFTFTK
jgi:hypothetical protein